MAKRRKKKAERIIHLSAGPLPPRLAERHAGCRLVFSDASQLRHGGLAAVLFADADSEPLVATRSVPTIGSNELELQAALFALEQASRHFPGQPAALFSDNLDAVTRLGRAKAEGSAQDGVLVERFPCLDIDALLLTVDVCWIPGHGRCRGNALADLHARSAAA